MKAQAEMIALGLGLTEDDAVAIIEGLAVEDFEARVESQATGEPMYIFHPRIWGTALYLKLVLRSYCVVVSFHERGPEANGQDEEG
jgi:hypothetical protein